MIVLNIVIARPKYKSVINSCLDFVAHDDEPYTIGSSSVSIPRLALPFETSFAILMSKDCYLSRKGIKFKTQVDVYDFVKKRGMFVATQRTQVLRFMVEAHAIRYHLCVPCDFNSFAGRFHF